MNYYNKLQKYIHKVNNFKGGIVYKYLDDGFQRLINTMITIRNKLPVDRNDLILKDPLDEYIYWGDNADGEEYNKIVNKFRLIDAYFPGFIKIWKELYTYVHIDTQNYFTVKIPIDKEIDEELNRKLNNKLREELNYKTYKFSMNLLDTIYDKIHLDIIDPSRLCRYRFSPHDNSLCQNSFGVKDVNLLHWPDSNCSHDNDPKTTQNQFKGGCGQHLRGKCSFLHKDQFKYIIMRNNIIYVRSIGFNTVPGKGRWYNGKPFVNNNNPIPTNPNFVSTIPYPPVEK